MLLYCDKQSTCMLVELKCMRSNSVDIEFRKKVLQKIWEFKLLPQQLVVVLWSELRTVENTPAVEQAAPWTPVPAHSTHQSEHWQIWSSSDRCGEELEQYGAFLLLEGRLGSWCPARRYHAFPSATWMLWCTVLGYQPVQGGGGEDREMKDWVAITS